MIVTETSEGTHVTLTEQERCTLCDALFIRSKQASDLYAKDYDAAFQVLVRKI